MNNLGEALRLFLVWDTHQQAIPPYKVCTQACGEGWPCDARSKADTELRAMGVDPYAVRRHEVSLEAADD